MATKSKRKQVTKKTAVAAKQRPAWLKNNNVRDLSQVSVLPEAPDRKRIASQSEDPPRLISKAEGMNIVGLSFPTIWEWMRLGKFPRSRVCGARVKWIEAEVIAWVNSLPERKLKGDATPKTERPREEMVK